jgi:hypothetical protein
MLFVLIERLLRKTSRGEDEDEDDEEEDGDDEEKGDEGLTIFRS